MTWNSEIKTCWDLKTLTAISGFEAISSSKAIFNATHTPLPIVRRTVVAPFDGGARSTENDLLSEFFESDNTDGALIIPVIGDRGVGKSHIIRFLFENRPMDAKAHVVYIPKSGTDLRTTIGLIIEGLDNRFDEIRTSLSTAQAHNPTPEEAVERLLVELYLKIERRAAQPLQEDTAATTSLFRNAASLLDDAVFRQQFSQLGGPSRIVSGPLGEDLDIPDEIRTVFSLADLPFGRITRDQLAESAREAYSLFSMSATAQTKFLQFINEALPAALQEVFWSNGPKLTTLLRDVRRLLMKDDREIFLLIEDLVVLSGLQEELLQAFITPAIELPGQPKSLAPLRVAFAMTNEPFRAIQETVVSRVKSVYAIDLSQGREDPDDQIFGQEAQIAFLSKYLNASRYSIEEISEFDEKNLGQHLPSKCDTCEVADNCLSDFGSHDGIGMYPFSTYALVNLLQTRSTVSFNPRGAIRGVLAEVLREGYDEIPEGRFPSDQLLNDFKNEQNVVSLDVMNEIETKFGSDTSRRINLQRFWSPNRSVRDPWTGWIRECFGLGDDSSRITPPPPPPLEETDEPSPPVQSTSNVDTFAFLDTWATGGATIIPETEARVLRTVLYELVTGQLADRYGISISKPLFQVGQMGTFLQRDSFIIAQSGGGGGVGLHPTFWTTEIDTGISTALIFKQILQCSSSGQQLSPPQLSALYKFIEPMILSAKSDYDRRYGDLSAELGELKFLAEIFGSSEVFLDDLLSDQFELGGNSNGRDGKWIELISRWAAKRVDSLHKLLAIAGAAKGDGGTLSTRVSVLISQQNVETSTLSDHDLATANEELLSDNKKLNEISQLLGGSEASQLFTELRNSFTEIDMHLGGQIIPQAQLYELTRRLDELDRNWNSDLLKPKDATGLTPEEIVKTVAGTDTMLIDEFLNELTELLHAVDAIVTRANELGNGNSTSNSTVVEIQNSLQDVQETMEKLK
jgi:hypothetical protein